MTKFQNNQDIFVKDLIKDSGRRGDQKIHPNKGCVKVMFYNPKQFKVENQNHIKEVITKNPFANLIALDQGEICVSHLPLLLKESEGQWILEGHLARSNPYQKIIHSQARHLVIFQGVHSYISPSWYVTEGQVPTWNYIAIHIEGQARVIEDQKEVIESLDRQVSHYESTYQSGWSLDQLRPGDAEKISRGIIVFEIKVDQVDAKFKMSQNRDSKDQKSLITNLDQTQPELSEWIKKMVAAATL